MDDVGRGAQRFRFGTFEADARTGELTRQGRKVKLQEQPFQILIALLERSGDLVTREELKQRIWPGDTVLDFDRGLNRAINRLRDALRDSADNPRFVETIPKRGYRLIAEVQDLEASMVAPLAVSASPQQAETLTSVSLSRTAKVRPGKRIVVAAAAGILLVAAVVWNTAHWRSRLSGAPAGPRIRSIAVLPFENLSNDRAQDYFADGITDELITDLAKLKRMRVISRTSVMFYKGKREPLPAIARTLGVDAVVEGSVVLSGRRVRITAQLLLAREDRHLWAESYERDLTDVLAIQHEIAAAVAHAVRGYLPPFPRPGATAVNTTAYADYLQGRFYWNRRTIPDTRAAIDYFERALGADPNFALGYAGLADCYSTMWAEQGAPDEEKLAAQATASAVRALELDPNLGEAHASLGYTYLFHDWNWAAAKRELDRAVELNANDADAHDWLSHYYIAMGQFDASLAESRTALEIDPLGHLRRAHMAWHFLYARQYDEVIQRSRRLVEQDPGMLGVLFFLGKAYERTGKLREARASLEKFAEAMHRTPPALAALAHLYAVSGERGKAQDLLTELLARSRSEFVSPGCFTEIYCGLNRHADALDWLERAYAARMPEMIYLAVEAEYDPLRAEPRFKALVSKLQLPALAFDAQLER